MADIGTIQGLNTSLITAPPHPCTRPQPQPRPQLTLETDAQDFGGFRTVLLIPRFRPAWPPPGAFEQEHPKGCTSLGAPRAPLPQLLPKSKPVSAATVRLGPGFMEVPFFATQETHRCELLQYS